MSLILITPIIKDIHTSRTSFTASLMPTAEGALDRQADRGIDRWAEEERNGNK